MNGLIYLGSTKSQELRVAGYYLQIVTWGGRRGAECEAEANGNTSSPFSKVFSPCVIRSEPGGVKDPNARLEEGFRE